MRQTLAMLGIPGTTYYRWYDRWSEGGLDALSDTTPHPGSVWNRLPDETRADVIEFALEHEDLTSCELAVKYTDEKQYFVSELSVYRILKPGLFIQFISGRLRAPESAVESSC